MEISVQKKQQICTAYGETIPTIPKSSRSAWRKCSRKWPKDAASNLPPQWAQLNNHISETQKRKPHRIHPEKHNQTKMEDNKSKSAANTHQGAKNITKCGFKGTESSKVSDVNVTAFAPCSSQFTPPKANRPNTKDKTNMFRNFPLCPPLFPPFGINKWCARRDKEWFVSGVVYVCRQGGARQGDSLPAGLWPS